MHKSPAQAQVVLDEESLPNKMKKSVNKGSNNAIVFLTNDYGVQAI